MKKSFALLGLLAIIAVMVSTIQPPHFVYARPSDLLNVSLIAYWKLDEASGTRLDELNGCGGSGCDLTDENTVTQATGQNGNAAQFTSANSEGLSHADNADLRTGDIDFSLAGWVYLDSKGSNRVMISKWDGASDLEYLVYFQSSADRFTFLVRKGDNSGNVSVTANNLGSPSTGTWYYIVAIHDSVNNQISIQVNNGTADTAAITTGVRSGTVTFALGRFGAGNYMNGRIDSVGFWKKVLSTTERTELYNSGAGCDYPFYDCEGTPTPTVTATDTRTPTATNTLVSTYTPTLTPTVTNTPEPSNCLVYQTMPSQSQLQQDMDDDEDANIRRSYCLPQGVLSITGDLTINAGQSLIGQSWDYYGYGTYINLQSDGRIVMKFQTTIEKLNIHQSSSATVPGIQSTGTSTETNAHLLTMRDIQMTGGNANTWAIVLENAYEFYLENLKLTTSSNGIKLSATNDHPWWPGDGTLNKVQVRILAANTTALLIAGQTAGGTYSTKYPTDITFISFYASGGDNPAFASSNMNCIQIVNASKLHFYGTNLEECTVDLSITGGVDGGPGIAAITFSDSWFAEAVEINSNVNEVIFTGCRLDAAPTGASAANAIITGTNMGLGSASPFILSPHYRGAYNSKTFSEEIYVTNGSGADFVSRRALKWMSSGDVTLMTSSDPIASFAGVTYSPLSNAASGYIVAFGNTNISVTGAAAIGDYLAIDPANPGKVISIGTDPDPANVIGIATTAGTNTTIIMRINPSTLGASSLTPCDDVVVDGETTRVCHEITYGDISVVSSLAALCLVIVLLVLAAITYNLVSTPRRTP